jgi:hypothetical protein
MHEGDAGGGGGGGWRIFSASYRGWTDARVCWNRLNGEMELNPRVVPFTNSPSAETSRKVGDEITASEVTSWEKWRGRGVVVVVMVMMKMRAN